VLLIAANAAILLTDREGMHDPLSSRSVWTTSVRLLLELIAPESCAACDVPIAREQLFCSECGAWPSAPVLPESQGSAAGAYAPPLSTAIRRLKFSRRADLARPLARQLPWPCLGDASQVTVVPVPLHYTRLVERGYNPAALLARELCRRVGARFAPELLVRCRATPQQSRLPARERQSNVQGAFRAPRSASGRSVVLLDDVVTTGATARACCQALYAAGVDHVTVLALAAATG
jgi:ComF family protein